MMTTTEFVKLTDDGSVHRLVIDVGIEVFDACNKCSLSGFCAFSDHALCANYDLSGINLCHCYFVEDNKIKTRTNVTMEVDGAKHRLVIMEDHSPCIRCSLYSVCNDKELCIEFIIAKRLFPNARFIKIK